MKPNAWIVPGMPERGSDNQLTATYPPMIKHLLVLFLAASMTVTAVELQTKTLLKTERFDRDPGWEGHNNRIVLKSVPTVKQDYGYSATHFAGKAAGKIGGRITRTTKPSSYAAQIAPKTLEDKLTASGSFAITASQPGAGVFFGWVNSKQPGGSGRPIGSLGLHMDFESNGARALSQALARLQDSRSDPCCFLLLFPVRDFRASPVRPFRLSPFGGIKLEQAPALRANASDDFVCSRCSRREIGEVDCHSQRDRWPCDGTQTSLGERGERNYYPELFHTSQRV